MTKPYISILVRAHNDEELIARTLEGIFRQRVELPFEVIVCDDNSTDKTREIAAKFPVRFFDPPAGPYKPGRTLNALVGAAQGEIVVFNNSDAVPVGEFWLSELVAPLLDKENGSVFAFANQLPRKNASLLVRKDNERAFGDGKIQSKWRFFFSLASSATWKRILVATPFDESIQYSEDVEWTWRNRERTKTKYCPSALVEHSHNYTLRELSKRFYGEGRADRVIFGDEPSLRREITSALVETARDLIYLIKHRGWREIPSAPIRRLVQRIAHFNGMKSK